MASEPLPPRARVVIIGGGIIGCSIAYWLTKMGERAVEPLKAYLRKETALTFALQALLAILPKEQAIGELLALFDVYGPDDYRSDEQKKQLVLVLAEQDDEWRLCRRYFSEESMAPLFEPPALAKIAAKSSTKPTRKAA